MDSSRTVCICAYTSSSVYIGPADATQAIGRCVVFWSSLVICRAGDPPRDRANLFPVPLAWPLIILFAHRADRRENRQTMVIVESSPPNLDDPSETYLPRREFWLVPSRVVSCALEVASGHRTQTSPSRLKDGEQSSDKIPPGPKLDALIVEEFWPGRNPNTKLRW